MTDSVEQNPAGDAPAGDAPAGDAPAGDSPAGDSPAVQKELSEDEPASDAQAVKTERSLTSSELNQRIIVITVMGLMAASFGAVIWVAIAHPAQDLARIATLVVTPIVSFAGPIMGFYFSEGDRRR